MKSNISVGVSLIITMLGFTAMFPWSGMTKVPAQTTPGDLVINLTWERSTESFDSIPFSNVPGGSSNEGLALSINPDQVVFDNGVYTPAANNSKVPLGNEWASWPQWHGNCGRSFEVRRLHTSFYLTNDINTFADLILFSPYYTSQGDIIPINDNIYVYLNGTLIGRKGTSYGARNIGLGGSAQFANETDGWYQDGSFGSTAVEVLQPGVNILDVISEEHCLWGGIGRLDLRLIRGLVIPLSWERSNESSNSVPYGTTLGSAVDKGLSLPLDPNQVTFDNGLYTPPANKSNTPNINLWASWSQWHGGCNSTYEVRRLRATFMLPTGVGTAQDLILFSPYYTERGDIIPINDNIYVYLNGLLIGKKGVRYGAKNAGQSGSAPFANETDGWYQDGSFGSAAVEVLQPGSNILDVISEEHCLWGGIGRLDLKLIGIRPISIHLSLPFPHENNENGLDRIWSFFDHEYPYGLLTPEPTENAGTILKYVGPPRLNGTINDCTAYSSCYSGHDGYDFSRLSDIMADHDGEVPVLSAAGGDITSGVECGLPFVRINHGRYQTTYLHLKPNDPYLRQSGHVNQGERIGTLYNRAALPCSTGQHLHFGLYYDRNNNGIFEANEKADPYGWNRAYVDPWELQTGTASDWLWEFSEPNMINIVPGTGQVLATSDDVFVTVPEGAVISPMILAYSIAPDPSADQAANVSVANSIVIPNDLTTITIGRAFQLSAVYTDGVPLTEFNEPIDIDITYDDVDVVYGDKSSLAIYKWDQASASWIILPTNINPTENFATASATEPGLFSLRAYPINPAPSVTLVEPSSVGNTVGIELTIHGENLMPGLSANLGIGALNVQYVSSTVLRSNISFQMVPGNYDLTLRNPDGQITFVPNALTVPYPIFLPVTIRGK